MLLGGSTGRWNHRGMPQGIQASPLLLYIKGDIGGYIFVKCILSKSIYASFEV